MIPMRKFRKRVDQKTKFLTLMMVLVLLVLTGSLFFLSNVTNPVIELNIIGENVKFVQSGETARYPIEVENKGPVEAQVRLETLDVPGGWEAMLSHEKITLRSGEVGLVFLSVVPPSTDSNELARVAEIGVRAPGNITIGTITILRGTAMLTRDGETSALGFGDDILSGDIVSTTGESVIAIDPSTLINNSQTYTGIIYVLLSDATVGFLRWHDTAYMTFISGEVTIWIPGGGGGGRGRAPPAAPVINLSEMPLIDTEFPDHEYNVVMEFGSLEEHSFFFLNVTGDATTVEVFGGEVAVGSRTSTRSLKKFEQTTAVRTVEVPEPLAVRRTIITQKSNGSVKGVVESQGTNVLDLPDVHYMPTEEMDFYVTPLLPEITIDLDGLKDGEYTVNVTQIEDFTGKTFGVETTATENTTDDLVFEDEALKFRNMEEGKTYDLTVGYENTKTGEESQFEIVEVKSSEEEQSIAVDDWEKLDEDDGELRFKQGDKEVKVKDGATGEDIENSLEGEEKEEKFPWFAVGVVALLVLIVIGATAYLGYLPMVFVRKTRKLIVLSCNVSPTSPTVGEKTEIMTVLRNEEIVLKANEHKIVVAFFDEFTLIGELDVSDKDFESEKDIELPVCEWIPEKSGERPITVVIEIDDEEVEEYSFMVMVNE